MAINVIMPKWGLTMKDAKIVKWLKEEGESVQKDEPLATVMTEKITSEVTAPEAGVLARIIAPVGTIVPVTGVIAIIADPGEEIPEEIAALPTVEQAPEVGSAPPQKVRAAAEEGEVPPVLASPLARRLAREHSVDLAQVTGTGPRGRVTEKDILAFVDAREKAPLPATAAPTRVVPFAGMRQMIAENMTQSLQTMAQVTLHTEVDATELVKLRGQLKTEFDLTYTDLLIRATVKALKSHPDLNATLVGDEIHLLEEIHIGMAVALKDGLLVPVVQ
ncbi:MAG: dihydrolipoamide acetyltransferase family protein, partial [Chloroflexota bacterium]|nr:dihydrolipoamide acetyltransferase family protein [Chloroflexota bacterium]